MADEVLEKTQDATIVNDGAAKAAEKKPRAKRQKAPKAQSSARQDSPNVEVGNIMLFNRYSYDVAVEDLSLKNYINIKKIAYPMTFRSSAGRDFSKANINIVERLANSLMRGGTGGKVGGKVIRTEGRLQGKKIKVMHIIEGAFDIVNKNSGKNPLQIFINALENSAPIEDTTRVIYGGIKSNVAVDISASRRLDVALRNIAMATITTSFNNRRTMSEALANEILMAANMDINSYAIKRKNEIERMARSAK